MHADQKLYLVFEFLDVDLKRYMEAGNSQGTPISLELCQVCAIFLLFLFPHLAPVDITCEHVTVRNAECPLIGASVHAPVGHARR